MNDPVASLRDSERFRDAIRRHLGLQFDDTKLAFLDEVLQRRLEKQGRTSDDYLHEFIRGPANGEVGLLAQDLTVSETYFFRNIEQFNAFRDIVVPDRLRARDSSRTLRVLSAACSSGEEAYSLAIVMKEVLPDSSWTVSIRAVDINPTVLGKAKRARYSGWALRETPAEIQRRWFRQDDREMALDESIRAAVTFDSKNLAVEDFDLWPFEYYDAVFCRNAMMYFAPEQARALVARIVRSLTPGGYLFLGHAETLRGISDEFHLCHTHGTFYYRRKDASEGRGSPAERSAAISLQPVAAPFAAGPALADAWMNSIRQSSERIEALTAPSAAALAVRPVPVATPGWDLARVFDLLRGERFSEALTYVQTLPPEADNDSDVLLVKAMLLAHGGEYEAAAAVCRRLVELDELNAGAHYVLALCREGVGDQIGAIENDRVAIYLDAAFAMPRLHLGLLARRIRSRDLARRELGRAFDLLKLEDASRLLLFGGGFSRQALIALCESALLDCGGPL